jgi:hypothetical protein
MFKSTQSIDLGFSDPLVKATELDFSDTAPVDKVAPVEGEKIPEPVKTDPTKEDFSLTLDTTDSKDDLSFDLGENKNADANVEIENEYVNIANSLADNIFGGNLKPYEGFDDTTEPTLEVISKLIAHNVDLAKDEAIQDFYTNDISPVTQRIIDFDLESKDPAEILSFMRALVEENNIKTLSLDNEFDQEKIVRTWFQNENWTSEEVDEKVADLKTAGLLSKEATRIKPKLDQKTEEVARKKEEGVREMKAMEQNRRQNFLSKVQNTLKTQKLGEVALTTEETKRLTAIMDSNPISVNLPNGSKTEMPYLEALIAYNRFSEKGDIETLALAALLLSDRKAFDEKYKRVVENKVTNEFVKDHKYDTTSKSGQLKTTPKDQPVKQASRWNLKVNQPR